jgi:hypothetical protein
MGTFARTVPLLALLVPVGACAASSENLEMSPIETADGPTRMRLAQRYGLRYQLGTRRRSTSAAMPSGCCGRAKR